MVSSEGSLDGYLVVVSDAASLDDVGAGDHVPPPSLSTPHLLDVVLDRAPDVVTILNADGSWRWSNRAAIRLFGHLEQFDPSQGVFGLLHPDDVPAARRVLDRARAGELRDDERIELRLRAADGSWRWMEALCDVLMDDPSVRGIVVHLRDITETRRALGALEATNRRLANLVGTMHTAVVLQDEAQRVVLANQAFVDLFRIPMTPEELVGRTLESIGVSAERMVAEPADAARALSDIRASGRPVEGVRCVLFDGRTIECDFVPVLVQGVDRGRLSTFRDVTGQARAEAERERLLASEREENRRLAELDAYRAESIAAVSHELRTPLTSIVGYTQLLRGMLEPVVSDEEAACLDAIVRNVDRLLRLAGDVVSLDSLESRTMPIPISGVDVPAVVRRAARTVTPEAVDRSIELVVETLPGPEVQGDEDRLAQLVENLLSNAVKFTLPGGKVTVRAVPAEPRAEAVWDIVVEDTGIGIPEDEVVMLSTRFFRASNARRRGFTGSGLGLSVARAIAERHNGSLSVESVVGVGTSVRVRIGSATEPLASL
jgi:PAS domain S-box-containing protein